MTKFNFSPNRYRRLIDLSLVLPSTDFLSCASSPTELCFAYQQGLGTKLYGFDIRTGKLLYETNCTSLLAKISFFGDELIALEKVPDKRLSFVERTTGLVYSSVSLQQFPDFAGPFLFNETWSLSSDNTNMYIVSEDNYLFKFSLSQLTMQKVNNLFDPQKLIKKETYFDTSTKELILYSVDDQKLYIYDEFGYSLRNLELSKDMIDKNYQVPTVAISGYKNTLYSLRLPSNEVFQLDVKPRAEYMDLQFSDKSLNLNGINELFVRTFNMTNVGLPSLVGESVEFRNIQQIDLLGYLTRNLSNQTVVTNVSQIGNSSITDSKNHVHIIGEQFDESILVNKVYTIVTNKPLLDKSTELYQSGLRKTSFSHNITLSSVSRDYEEFLDQTPPNIELTNIPTVNTPFVINYLLIDELSYNHTHYTEEPVLISPNIYKLSNIPEFNSLELYKESLLLRKNIDYSIITDTISLIPPQDEINSPTTLQASYILPGTQGNYTKHIHVINSFFVEYAKITDPLAKRNFFLSEIPIDLQNIKVFRHGLIMKRGRDYVVSGQTIKFLYDVADLSVITVSFIIAGDTIPDILKPLDSQIGTSLEIQPGEYWLIYSNIQTTPIEGIQLTYDLSDTIPSDFIGELESTLQVVSALSLKNNSSFRTTEDIYDVIEEVVATPVLQETKISSFDHTKKSQLLTSYLGVVNTGNLPVLLRDFKVFTVERNPIGVLKEPTELITSTGQALTRYSAFQNAANFIKESTLQTTNSWEFIGNAIVTELDANYFTPKSIMCTSTGESNRFARAIQQVEIGQFYKRPLTFSVFITSKTTRAYPDPVGNSFVPSGSFSLIITPTYLVVSEDEVTSTEVLGDPITLIDFPKGLYQNRRFARTWLPDFPVVRLTYQLNCEREVVGTVYFKDFQVQEGSLSIYTPSNPLEKIIKGVVKY